MVVVPGTPGPGSGRVAGIDRQPGPGNSLVDSPAVAAAIGRDIGPEQVKGLPGKGVPGRSGNIGW
jgi:hypothetical protein